VVPVAIVFSVCLVVPARIAQRITQGETIVTGQVVHARHRTRLLPGEDPRGPRKPIGESARRQFLTDPETAHLVAIPVVPLQNLRGELPEQIALRPKIPGLGDEKTIAKHRVGSHAAPEVPLFLRGDPSVGTVARGGGGKVEAKTVHAVVLHPVAQTLQYPLADLRLREIQRIAAAAPVAQRAVRIHPVVQCGIQRAQVKGGTLGIQFGAVVVDHIKHHLEPCRMQCGDSVAQRLPPGLPGTTRRSLATGCQIGRMRCTPGKNVVAPVVRQSQPGESRLISMRTDRHKAQRGHA